MKVEEERALGEKSREGKDKDHHILKQMILIALLWVLWAAGISALLFPRLERAWKESGVAELMAQSRRSNESVPVDRTVSIALLSQDDVKLYTLETRRRGSDVYHDTIEALLNDYAYDSYSEGSVSLIAPETKLIGLTVKSGICYVDFSREFLDSREFEGVTASDLVERTLLNFEKISKVVILVEGQEIKK
ncbi:MAG: GerMN domain-containing protein [Spirochaetales bacterium]|nr:GerMN domain-containing protein [Spirochaetales bacterium]